MSTLDMGQIITLKARLDEAKLEKTEEITIKVSELEALLAADIETVSQHRRSLPRR